MGLSFSADDGHQATGSDSSLTAQNISSSTNTGSSLETATSQLADNQALNNDATTSNDPSGQTPPMAAAGGSNMMNESTTLAPNGTSSDEDFRLNLFGNDVYPFKWMTWPTIYSWLGPISSVAMVVGCVLPYVPQYITIRKKHSSKGFSTLVCLTLLIANITRIAFWFGHPFELPLLVQSAIMIPAQLLLLEICVRFKRESSVYKKTILSLKPQHFWQWTDLCSYFVFLIIFTGLLALAVYLYIDCKPFIESLGLFALVTESMLGSPQVIKNYRNRSVVGMSLSMVLMWLAGDTFKTVYFIANAVPYQFWLCGLLQITIDLLILFQVCLFRQNAPMKTSSRVDHSPKEMMAL